MLHRSVLVEIYVLFNLWILFFSPTNPHLTSDILTFLHSLSYSSPCPLFPSWKVLSSHRAFNNPLSFIHDILITNNVINILPNQCFPSITAGQSGLILHRKRDRLLGRNINVANVREFIREWRSILRRCCCFWSILNQLVLFVTVTTHLSSVYCSLSFGTKNMQFVMLTLVMVDFKWEANCSLLGDRHGCDPPFSPNWTSCLIQWLP